MEEIRSLYPKGTQVCLEHMNGEARMPFGLIGEVDHVDDMGQIHVKWKNGSGLALIPGADRFHRIDGKGKTDMEISDRLKTKKPGGLIR